MLLLLPHPSGWSLKDHQTDGEAQSKHEKYWFSQGRGRLNHHQMPAGYSLERGRTPATPEKRQKASEDLPDPSRRRRHPYQECPPAESGKQTPGNHPCHLAALPVLVKLNGKVCHVLQSFVGEAHVHVNVPLPVTEGAGDLQAFGFHGRQPDLKGHRGNRGQESNGAGAGEMLTSCLLHFKGG